MSLDFEKLETILAEAAAERDPVQRAARLDQACGGDLELRAEVVRLLAADEQAGDFLETPMVQGIQQAETGGQNAEDQQTVVVTEPFEKPGTMIGRFKLLEEIGEGGFGVVYMAEQMEPVQRQVALKIIKAGMDTREVVARFEAERQALALMDHPNIAQVFDGGVTQAGRPYFVMELVRGISITEFCDQRNLSMKERLKLFIQVCHAVQHAHQKAIIHRDLKPSNILITLIDGKPVPKIIDFGVAKALGHKLTERTLFTGFLKMVGTPAYMSPEQADLSGVDIDTRADIYALGVLLYELLTGVTPFSSETLHQAALDEIRRMIRETEPPKPSTRLRAMGQKLTEAAKHRQTEPTALSRLVRGDLDWIVMKCLEKDRGRRYETARSLADDIERHLDYQPVLASPPTAVYRLRKFVRRHRAGVAVGTGMGAAVMLGLVFALAGFAEARRERDHALVTEQRAQGERDRALAAEKQAQAEAERSQQVAQFLKDMLQRARPSAALGRDTTLLREILDETAERLDRDLAGQPEVELDLRNTLGWIYYDLGDDVAAEEFHRTALTLSRRLQGDARQHVADSLHGLALAVWRQGKLTEAEAAQREALSLRRDLFGNDNLDTARSINDLALILVSQGKPVEAESMVREALSIRRKFLREPHTDIAESLNLLAIALGDQGKLADAEATHRETLAMCQQLYGQKHPEVAFSLGALGTVLAKEGRTVEAETLLYESIKMQQELQRGIHPESQMARYSLAKLLVDEGNMAETAEILGLPAGTEPAAVLDGIAWPLATSPHASLRDGVTAVRFSERAVAATKRSKAAYLDTLAAAYAEAGQFDQATTTVIEAIGLLPDGKLKEDYRSRLKIYAANSPYREPLNEHSSHR